jgi:cytochrome oxidase Cu insertion factor (SCO1/SenC/PrrC family)
MVAAIMLAGMLAATCTRQEASPKPDQTPIAVGDTAPPFELRSANGGTVSLSDYVGKPALLYFSMGPG